MTKGIELLLTYLLSVAAISATVGLVVFLISLRGLMQRRKNFDEMSERIRKNRELKGKATSHEVDWNGPVPISRRAPPKPKHPHT